MNPKQLRTTMHCILRFAAYFIRPGRTGTMEVLITDVTVMHGGNYCVAGWSPNDAKMVRPLPSGHHWNAALLTKHNIVPGSLIDVQPSGKPNGGFPHRTEDTPIDPERIDLVAAGFADWTGPRAPPTSSTIMEGFSGNLLWNSVWQNIRQGVYVSERKQCASLAAIVVDRRWIALREDFGKLKAVVSDGQDQYKVAVSSRVLREAWEQGGLGAAEAALPVREQLHVRVSLARAYQGEPVKCYMMLNGAL
jgi:hypothetical protein